MATITSYLPSFLGNISNFSQQLLLGTLIILLILIAVALVTVGNNFVKLRVHANRVAIQKGLYHVKAKRFTDVSPDSESESALRYLEQRSTKIGMDHSKRHPSSALPSADLGSPRLTSYGSMGMGRNANPDIVVSRTMSLSKKSPSFAARHGSTDVPSVIGKVMLSAQYSPGRQTLEITIRDGYNLSCLGDQDHCYIRLALLPVDVYKHDPEYKSANAVGATPRFMQTFVFSGVAQEVISLLTLHLSLHLTHGDTLLGNSSSSGDCLLGIATLPLSLIDGRTMTATSHLLNMMDGEKGKCGEPSPRPRLDSLDAKGTTSHLRRASVVTADGTYQTMPTGREAELLLTLCYNDETGKLIVGVDKGSCLTHQEKTYDTFVKVCVFSAFGDELGKGKTPVCQAGDDPVYGSQFAFLVAHSDVAYVKVVVQVYCYVGIWRRRTLIGQLTFGHQSADEEVDAHWSNMLNSMGISVQKWHVLTKGDDGK